MLIATLINREGKSAILEAEAWEHRVPPQILLRDGRAFSWDGTGWEPTDYGTPCIATFRELPAIRLLDCTGLPLRSNKPEPAPEPAIEQEEEAA